VEVLALRFLALMPGGRAMQRVAMQRQPVGARKKKKKRISIDLPEEYT